MMISETLYDFINVSNRYKIMFNHIKVLSQAFKWSTWSDKSVTHDLLSPSVSDREFTLYYPVKVFQCNPPSAQTSRVCVTSDLIYKR